MNRPPEPPRLPAWQRLLLLALALLNLWVCYGALQRRRILGLVNGALAIGLLVLAAVTGARRRRGT